MSDMVAEYRLHEFTVEQFHRMAEVGIIDSDDRVELLDGYVVEMSPIGLRHWDRHATIVRYLIETLRLRATVVGQGSFPLGLRSEPQPDIAILAARNYELDGTLPAPHELEYRNVATVARGDSLSLTALPEISLASAPFLRPLR